MKRSRNINLDKMRKKAFALPVKPLALAIASITLTACSDPKEDVKFVSSVDDCTENTSLTLEQCQVAYKKAVEEAAQTAPRYSTREQCENDFGFNQCTASQSSNTFMPLLTGFLVGNALSNHRHHSYTPVYQYRNVRSSSRDSIITGSGDIIGRPGKRSYHIDASELNTKSNYKSKATRTASRGGFGSVSSAKSSWGGGRSRGWGG